MKPDEAFGAMIGFVIGVLSMTLFATYLRDRGREECNLHLPRTEECVQVWVPPSKEKK